MHLSPVKFYRETETGSPDIILGCDYFLFYFINYINHAMQNTNLLHIYGQEMFLIH